MSEYRNEFIPGFKQRQQNNGSKCYKILLWHILIMGNRDY